jgi:glutamate synthase (NADPH/NADH) large chain
MVGDGHWAARLQELIERHAAETGSLKAQEILRYWDMERDNFVMVCPIEMLDKLAHPLADQAEAIPAE